jgi:hypothetical protein
MGLIDDFVQNISKEVGKVQARSQEMLQTYNLSGQIRELERKKTAKLLEIGRLMCDKYQNNKEVPEATVKDKVNEVVGYDHEILLLQTELDSIRMANDPEAPASKRADSKAGFNPTPGFECPTCHAPASKDKAFCPICGGSLKKPADDQDVVDVEPNSTN